MNSQRLQSDRFKRELSHYIEQEVLSIPSRTVAKNAQVYRSGEPDNGVYFIERGQVKLLMRSSESKHCLLSIHTAGDIFGESGLSGVGGRLETAIAMEESTLKEIPRLQFFEQLNHDAMFLESFVRYLAERLADQQEIIANLTTIDSEQRLGKTLLRLAHTLGKKDPQSVCIELRITHEELSEMVGTTRPRISVFMQRFRNMGLIELNAAHFMTIQESKLTAYLAQIG